MEDAGELDDAQESLEKVREILEPLDRSEKTKLFNTIESGSLATSSMEQEVKRILVELLNGARTEHARRLWTDWFEPILQRDDLSLLSDVRFPGQMHIVDAGGWWFALSTHMKSTSSRIHDAIVDRSQDRPLDTLFASPEGQAWAEELRRATLAAIANIKRNPVETQRLVANANTHRTRMIGERGLKSATALNPADLLILEAMLDAAPGWKIIGRPDKISDEALVHFASSIVRQRTCSPEGAALFALSRLHNQHSPSFAIMVYREFYLPVVQDAIVVHFQFAAQLLRQWLEVRYLGGLATVHSAIEKMTLPAVHEQMFGWYDTIHSLELDRDPKYVSAVRAAFGDVITTLDDLVATLSKRVLSMNPHVPPISLIDRIEYVKVFADSLQQRGFSTSKQPWHSSVGEHVGYLFRTISATGAQQPNPEKSLPQVAQIVHLSEMLGYPLEITAINTALITIVEAAIRSKSRFDHFERSLIEKLIERSKLEMKRSKWWVSPEIMRFLELVEGSYPKH